LKDLKGKLKINAKNLKEINDFILRKDNPLVDKLLEIVERHGGINEINRKAKENRKLENLMKKLEKKKSPFIKDLEWLTKQRNKEAFISISDYRRKILGKKANSTKFDDSLAVTLEISALNFFPWLIEEAKHSIAKQNLMPSRYIRVRSMKEQVEDNDVLAFAAAMQIIGASYVQTLDAKGTFPGANGKPVNVHLGGADTITGYF